LRKVKAKVGKGEIGSQIMWGGKVVILRKLEKKIE